MNFRALREGGGVFASKARYGPTPLRYGFWWAGLRGIRPLRAEEALGRRSFRALRWGFGVRLQGSLRPDTAPLGFWWARMVHQRSGMRQAFRTPTAVRQN